MIKRDISDKFTVYENMTVAEMKTTRKKLEDSGFKQSKGKNFTVLALGVRYSMKVDEVDFFVNNETETMMVLAKGVAVVISSKDPTIKEGESFEGASALWKGNGEPAIGSVVEITTSENKKTGAIYAAIAEMVDTKNSETVVGNTIDEKLDTMKTPALKKYIKDMELDITVKTGDLPVDIRESIKKALLVEEGSN
jgi:hypothetical protein